MNPEIWANNLFKEIKSKGNIDDVKKVYEMNLRLIKAGKTEDEVKIFLSSLEGLAKKYTKPLDNGSVLEKMDESQSAHQTNENVKKLLELIQQTKKELGLV
ncbi:hypothetical protein KP612_01475 [Treponema denticola]|uniref:Uncharacterized protein n=1 Tax=Treponema denticola H-22 TaxID=999432 RepID=A0A0E2E3F3_TREDN|nr:hypothetical protein [Treponema denticola]EMB31656.1 hypothetical protein HMPREF9726_02036 [Treponema denticola H-22]